MVARCRHAPATPARPGRSFPLSPAAGEGTALGPVTARLGSLARHASDRGWGSSIPRWRSRADSTSAVSIGGVLLDEATRLAGPRCGGVVGEVPYRPLGTTQLDRRLPPPS